MRAYYSTPACCNPLFPPIITRFSAVSAAVSRPFGPPSTEGAPGSRTVITQDSPSCLLLSRPFSPLSASKAGLHSSTLKRDLHRQRHLRTANVKAAAGRG